jgi:hypothetical protein
LALQGGWGWDGGEANGRRVNARERESCCALTLTNHKRNSAGKRRRDVREEMCENARNTTRPPHDHHTTTTTRPRLRLEGPLLTWADGQGSLVRRPTARHTQEASPIHPAHRS